MYGAHSTGSGPARGQDEIKPNTRGPNNNSAGINQNGVASIFWTEARIAGLRERWTAGESSSVVAAAFGTTRNAIIGKVHRLKLERRVVKNDAPAKISRRQRSHIALRKMPAPKLGRLTARTRRMDRQSKTRRSLRELSMSRRTAGTSSTSGCQTNVITRTKIETPMVSSRSAAIR
jgi:hypothetical protein